MGYNSWNEMDEDDEIIEKIRELLYEKLADAANKLRDKLEKEYPDKIEEIRDIFDRDDDVNCYAPGYYALESDGEIITYQSNAIVYQYLNDAEFAYKDTGNIGKIDFESFFDDVREMIEE